MLNYLIFLLATISLSDGCLKIGYSQPPACACKALGLTSSNLKDYVKDSSQYYQKLTAGFVRAPVVSVDDCAVNMYCEGGAELYVFGTTEQEGYFGEYALDGFCNAYAQSWQVFANEELKSFKELNGVCLQKPLPDVRCSPTDKATFLFAQSTDVVTRDASKAMHDLIYSGVTDNAKTTRFQTIGYVRFDMKTEEEIVYYNGWRDVQNMMPPLIERPQGLDSIDGGSDVLKMIERFIDTSPQTACGAYIQIMMSRYPEETDIAFLVEKLRAYRIYLTIYIMTNPVAGGGSHPETMYELAMKTNGFCGHGSADSGWAQQNVFASYIIYAKNQPIPAGTGTITLPQLAIPTAGIYSIYLALQGPWDTDSFRNIDLTWSNTNSSSSSHYATSKEDIMGLQGRTYTGLFTTLDAVIYDFKLQYTYASANTMLIRVMSNIPVSYWLPYVN